MKVVEKFVSINGEGNRSGELAVFVRFKGCNLNCTYCDTKWANEIDCEYEEISPEDIYNFIKCTGVVNVTLTGGEPLLQKDMNLLLRLLMKDKNIRVEIETNGSVNLKPFITETRPQFTMDYKLPTSECEKSMCLDNFALLDEGDTVKFVVGSLEDLERAKSIILKYDLNYRCHVYISPVFKRIDPIEIVCFMKENLLNNVRLQIQMHKVIWNPMQIGV